MTAGGDGGEGTGGGGGTGRALQPHREPGALPGTRRHRATPAGSGRSTPEAAPRHRRSAALSPGWKLCRVGIPVPAGIWAGCESAGGQHPGARPTAGRGDAPVNEGVGHLSELPLGGVNQPQLGLTPNPRPPCDKAQQNPAVRDRNPSAPLCRRLRSSPRDKQHQSARRTAGPDMALLAAAFGERGCQKNRCKGSTSHPCKVFYGYF